ncbi:MAG: glycosyltransferase [Flavobacteriales bacterium]
MISSLILALMLYFYLRKPKWESAVGSPSEEACTIIIAFRNEEQHLPYLLKNFDNQELVNQEQIELIFVDDYSTDGGKTIVMDWMKTSNYKVKLLNNGIGKGKKAALRLAFRNSKSKILGFTDADVRLPSLWMYSMLAQFKSKQADLLIGSVWYHANASRFERFQQLELVVLQSVTAFSTENKFPFMCNGANLMVSRSLYQQFIDSDIGKSAQSGDDVFLLHTALKENKTIAYANHEQAFVLTFPEKNIKDFVNQRIRWSSKVKLYTSWQMLLPSVLFSIWSVLSLYFLWTNQILPLVLKFYFDYTLVQWFFKAYKRPFCSQDVVILSLIYPFYILEYFGISPFQAFCLER